MYHRLNHRVDLYTRSNTISAAGQRVPTWTISVAAQHCEFEGWSTTIRVSPSAEEAETVVIYFPGSVALNYQMRVYNIKDRVGNLISAGPYEILEIIKVTGFAGKIRHQKVMVRSIVE